MKILFLDADGVTLKNLTYFSKRYSKENNVPLEKITPFYANEFELCQQGKADMKIELAKYLPEWNWSGTMDEFCELWFSTSSFIDEEVFETISELRKQNIKCYLTSDQEKYRGNYLLENLDFKNRFDDCFFSYDIGYQKWQPEYFIEVLKKLNANPEDVIYWDDEEENIAVAKSLGIDARLFESADKFKEQVSSII